MRHKLQQKATQKATNENNFMEIVTLETHQQLS